MSKESKTLFIRNLAYSTTKEKLEEVFSDIGPIKQCFIVLDRETGKSKGYGYVQFTLREDAVTAKDTVKNIDGRAVFVDYASITKKKTKKERWEDKVKKKQKAGDNYAKGRDNVDTGFDDSDADHEELSDDDRDNDNDDKREDVENERKKEEGSGGKNDIKGSSPKKTDWRYHKAKIVVLGGLPAETTQEEVEKSLQKLKVKHVAEVKLIGDQIHVKFRSIREAKNGIRKLNGQVYKDNELTAVQLSEINLNTPPSVLKRSRLIVRNLSFKCSEDDLSKAFETCEGMTDVSIPVKPDGKKFGFGFVQFNSLRNAMKAVEQMNAKKILGRPVAVDWVLPKDKYEAKQSSKKDEKQDETIQEDKIKSPGKRKEFDEKSDDGGSSSAENDNDEENQASSDEDEESNDDDDDGGSEEESDKGSDNGDDVDDDSETELGSNKKKTKAETPRTKPSDVGEGKTIFIRNLSFKRTDEDLEEHFTKFGEVEYCRVVVDPQTEHSKGMGFVKFTSKESAEKCIQEAENPGVVLDGRHLIISLAVSREESSKFNEKKQKLKTDNRNLYLAREGMIRPGTQAAEGLSKLDLNKRMRVEAVKREKLKNDNIFISPYRLCVRNIPTFVDEKMLKKIYLKAAEDKSAVVTESRIMRDFKSATGNAHGKSLGYGFVCFKEHQHALAALRHTNNNPDIFGEKKRLIVEFSLENRKALVAKQRRIERQKLKQEAQKTKSDEISPTQKATKPGKSPKVEVLTLTEKDTKLKEPTPAGKKVLPSHWGPKIRHKQRPAQFERKKLEKKLRKKKMMPKKEKKEVILKNEGMKRKLEGKAEGPKGNKRKKYMDKDGQDKFDKMVNKYKQTITNKSKWFA